MSETRAQPNDEMADAGALAAARRWLGEGAPVALATVVATWGSSPVPVGGQMAIASGQRFQGSVSGGCVENDVIVAADEVMTTGAPQLLSFGVSDETAWRAGLPCGGTIEVLVVRLDPERASAMLDALASRRAARLRSVVTTDVRTGEMTLFESDADFPARIAEIAGRGESRLIEREQQASTFVNVLTPAPRIVVVGATHIAQHLAAMLRIIGYACVIVDPRTAYANPERFAGVEIVAQWPDEAMRAIGLDPGSAVAAVSHNPDIDDPALALALSAGCFYVGALGSSRNHARRRQRLAASGVPPELIERIRAPIGLDIGAHGAAEIAASVVAEIIAAHRGRGRA